MPLKLKALEKNILKYRALQMVLLLHQVETLRVFMIGSIRATDKLQDTDKKRLPEGTKKPLEQALAILVQKDVITDADSRDLQNIVAIRNKIGHRVHDLVKDITAPEIFSGRDPVYDYYALARFETHRDKISRGMAKHFILLMGDDILFDRAEEAYKEELARLHKRIDRQYSIRRAAVHSIASPTANAI